MGTFFTSLLLVPLLAGAPMPGGSICQTGSDGLPIPTTSLEVNFDENFSVAQLIDAYCETTGARILSTPSVQTVAQSIEVSGFGGVLSIAPEDIQTFFEGVLSNNGFRLALRNTKAVTTFDLYNGNGGHRNQGDLNWRLVSEDELDVWADNSAILISTTLELKGIDVRQLSTNLRPLLQDPMFNTILNMGSSNGMILRGTGSQIASVGRMVKEIDEKSTQARAQVSSRAVTAQSSQKETEQTSITLVDESAQAPTPLADRPHLLTTVIESKGNIQDTLHTLQSLSSNRHTAENASRIWFVGDNCANVMWPKPRVTMIYNRKAGAPEDEGKFVIQATQEDIDWIVKLEDMVSGLTE